MKVPYENYRKVFRASQRIIEKDLTAVQGACTELGKRSKSNNCTAEETVKALDGMITRVETLKRKVCANAISAAER